ncbi:AAA family ATPase [Acetobacter thailandicus]|uniref:AAA family ATPase n=1 Tax=Acetobacter thailandicus TaxID=1502842 RepID=UPI001BADEF1C|nr:AAA family ATPase [Acetobacter thailandicus]MBS0980709.1 AAA family ATPase [Acetobacter thailandicus]
MILTEIQLNGVRRFTSPIKLEGLGPGLNILALPNESGKSTLLLALRAALMWRHSSGGEQIKSLASYGGSEPHIILRFMWGSVPCAFEKRFLKKKGARLLMGGEQYQGDEAEEKIRNLLGLNDLINKNSVATGLWSALLVPQGESQYLPELTDAGYTSIRSCLDQGSGSVAPAGGGKAALLLSRVREKLSPLLTEKKGEPTGGYKQALHKEAELTERFEQLKANRLRLADDLTALERDRRVLRDLENPERRAEAKSQLEQVRQERDRVSQFALKEKEVLAGVRLAEGVYETLKAEQLRRCENRDRQKELSEQMQSAQQQLAQLRDHALHAQDKLTEAGNKRKKAHEQYERSDRRNKSITRQRLLEQDQEALKSDRTVLHRLEQASAVWRQAQAAFKACRVDQKAVDVLRKAERDCDKLQLQMEAQAPSVSLHLLPEAADRVTVNGSLCSESTFKVLEQTRIEIEGVGALSITPALQEQQGAQARWHDAKKQLEQALQKVGCSTMAEAEQAFDIYRQTKAEQDAAQRAVLSCLPENRQSTDQVSAVIASYQEQIADKEATLQQRSAELTTEQVTLFAEGEILQAAESDLEVEQALSVFREAQREEEDKVAVLKSIQSDETQKAADVSELGRALERARHEEETAQKHKTDAALEAESAQAELSLKDAHSKNEALAQEMAAEARSLSDLEGDIRRREEALSAQDGRIRGLHGDVRACEERVRQAEGEGLDEQIAETERLIKQAEHECRGYARESAALTLLKQTLEAAEQEQTERYLAPLVKVMQPAFSTVFPDMTLSLDASFGVQAITRRQTEQFSDLSMGTREQIAVLARLGFAQLLHQQQGKSLLVLDDALSFSDKQRRERLFEVLTDAARHFQILILTCRDDILSELGGHTLHLRPCEEMAELRV